MKVITVSGIQDAGKTSLIKELIGRVHGLGKRSAIIVNEEGQESYGDHFLERYDVTVRHIHGG